LSSLPANIFEILQKEKKKGGQTQQYEEDDHREMRELPGVGTAFFFYLIFIKGIRKDLWPTVLSFSYRFEQVIPFITHLLMKKTEKLSLKSIELIIFLSDPLLPKKKFNSSARLSLSFPITQEGEMQWLANHSSTNQYLLFFQALINWIMHCPSEDLRKRGRNAFTDALSIFTAEARHSLLSALLKGCPYPAVTSFFVYMLKEEVDSCYHGDDSEDNSTAYFASPKLLELLPLFMHAGGDIMDRIDLLLAGINFYRYLLIKDQQSRIGVWSKSQILSVKQGFIDPLEEEVKQLLVRYKRMEKGEDREEYNAVQGIGGFEMSEEEYKNVGEMAVNSLLMLMDLLQRVKEIIAARD